MFMDETKIQTEGRDYFYLVDSAEEHREEPMNRDRKNLVLSPRECDSSEIWIWRTVGICSKDRGGDVILWIYDGRWGKVC
jgi:hypothetical protein